AADVFIVALGEAAEAKAFPLLMQSRDAGLGAAMDYAGRSLKSQMKAADKAGARFAVILGEDEIAGEFVTLRDMSSSEQQQVPVSDIINKLCAEVKN
ncbi:MAG: His/Gly/Thr/Pro-type tRNA ligase C-terminal domain-containing protein, partial [Negativicutes bacterium]